MKILFVASEVAPFSKTGGLGDVAKSLPAALARLGHEVLVVTPYYASTTGKPEPLGVQLSLDFPFGTQRAALLSKNVGARHQVVFVDHPGYFGRDGIYGDAQGAYPDNARRFAFFSLAALGTAQALKFTPDVIHLNDWQTGLAAAALKTAFASTALAKARSVFTIHNLAYQGSFPKETMGELGLPWDLFTPDGLEFFDHVNFLKAGLAYADVLTTVSRRYAEEIQTEALGCGLDGLLRKRSHALHGILNGVDYAEWDPTRDPYIPARYSPDALGGKAECKKALRAHFGLREPGSRPLFGIVTRLTAQKGIDMLLGALPAALERDMEVVVLGNGDGPYESALRDIADAYPSRIGVEFGFDTRLSHWVEAGSDFFLMPSLWEPCGLNQMFSLRYGTPPIVRATGGLDDTVIDASHPHGTGFKFEHPLASGLLWAMNEAANVFHHPERLHVMQRNGMRLNFGWETSAEKYLHLYSAAQA